MIYLELFLGFLRVGFFSFGGAYAAIPLVRDIVLQYGWLSEDMVSYIIAVSESTPGPIMVNMATYVGSTQAGILGSVIATVTVVLPAFFIILLIMVALKTLLKNVYFQAVLSGLKPCVIGVILAVGVSMTAHSFISFSPAFSLDWKAAGLTALFALVYFGSRKVKKGGISPILLILFSAVCGIAVYGI